MRTTGWKVMGFLTAMVIGAAWSCAPASPGTEGSGAEEAAVTADTRQTLVVPKQARAEVLAEMRRMLEAVDGILDGIHAGDRQAVAEAARGGGTRYAVDMDPNVAQRLPAEFKELGMRTHRAFDAIAERAESEDPLPELIGDLGDLTGNCVACHVTWRLEPER